MRMTGEEMRARILALLQERATPTSAYDVLEALRGDNPKLAPTTIYRALAALVEQGSVHRLESVNAYMSCRCSDEHGEAPILSICGECGTVDEVVSSEVLKALSGIARRSGFAPTRHVIELHGLCATCDGVESQA